VRVAAIWRTLFENVCALATFAGIYQSLETIVQLCTYSLARVYVCEHVGSCTFIKFESLATTAAVTCKRVSV
jgi:hypothetical protein